MKPKEFARRRRQLIREMGDNAIAIIPTAGEKTRNRDVTYPFRPDSDFYYMTGFPEPEAVAVLAGGREQGEYVLFCRESDPDHEQWHGRRAGLEGACKRYGADDAFPFSDIDDILPGMLENRSRVYYAMGYYPEFDQQVIDWVARVRARKRSGIAAPSEIIALDRSLHEMRLVKSAAELEAIRSAVAISVKAHERAMRRTRPGRFEYEIEAELGYEFALGGARANAYPSIVAGGENGCILHYTENDAVLRDGDLLLIDAGCEYDSYAADITRTFPVNGRFSRAQRALYDIVLAAQLAAIDKTRAGMSFGDPHAAAVDIIVDGLMDLGLLKGRRKTVMEKEKYKDFYMHGTGHWLGMDVHDVGDYKIAEEWRLLEPGMVTTVEPGIYVPRNLRGPGKPYAGIGIRVEDDVLVTADGPEVLTAAVPKTVAELEQVVGADAPGRARPVRTKRARRKAA